MGGYRDEQVLGNIELSKENWQVHGKDSYGAWSQRIPKWPLSITFLLLITSLALFVVTLPSVRQRTEDIGYHRVHSPLWDVMRYQNVQFHAQIGSTPLFTGSVPPELSKTWEDVERADLILIHGHDMDALDEPKENATKLGNKYFTLIAAFRQFHWIDLVREFWVTLANKPHPIGINWLNVGRLVICAVDWTKLWPLHLGPAASGSGRDIQWVLQKAWDDDPTKDLAPWYLFDPAAVLEIRTTEKLKDARQEVEVMLGK
ncbi:hypothetical protein BDV32DRAFT_151296 [Aspergillus pseudonomiae]|uniref:Uncharacterized protein n=1 Tax=Aspergillus pseudonomiae TaxID=1506151 RepID=A0A5N7DBR7_9EURO|nr:uncharacterized protein BDV37DRAFT_284014 [Aspergillus pseudonomiae]KAB8258478.1 hypothetical protein BDV32DRAFT_151296 [Aspergillus pseudonomiae]KAE8403218.1 hypothetical protein BDV37DRAFT_284014 [Aspergillus pseudonomiae]